MDTRVALISIIVENNEVIDDINRFLHEAGKYIIGRMGIPYREKGINIISIAIDAPQDVISSLSGKIGRLRGVSAKTAYSNLITKVEDSDEFPRPVLASVSGTCASVRLDSLISLAFKTSRSSMVSYIEGGQVFVNGKLITSNGYEPKDGDIISVRGKGRFIFDGVSHQTKKGRCSVRIMRYV